MARESENFRPGGLVQSSSTYHLTDGYLIVELVTATTRAPGGRSHAAAAPALGGDIAAGTLKYCQLHSVLIKTMGSLNSKGFKCPWQ